MNTEELCYKQSKIVFAVNQIPFENGENTFCTLYPLMTLDGERLSPDDFPNRGWIWWLVRTDIKNMVPGVLMTGTIEHAKIFDEYDHTKDKYQVRRDIQTGGSGLLEVLDIKEDEPDLDIIYKNKKLPWIKPIFTHVYIRGRKSVIGPFSASWSSETKTLSLNVLSPAKPEFMHVPTDAFNSYARIEKFKFFPYDSPTEMDLNILVSSRLDLDKLKQKAKIYDASNDVQILNWACKQISLSKSDQRVVKEFLKKISENEWPTHEHRFERLKTIAEDSRRVLELSDEVAKEIANSFFEDLINKHVEKITEQRVAGQITEREKEIKAAIEDQLRRKDSIARELKKLDEEYDRKSKKQEEDLQVKMKGRIDELEIREKRVEAREKTLNEQETGLKERLQNVIKRYHDEAERVGEDLLTQLPLLSKLAFLNQGAFQGGEESRKREQLEPKKIIKGFDELKETQHIEEKEFIRRFSDIVERKGFVFEKECLINFHICMKIGGLIVLAGPSGTGKSSLTKLYADALGCHGEYLQIPVKPDWLDDKDLLGAFNPLSRRFEPSNNRLTERLIAATLDKKIRRGGIYLICLDEMNLARVEHYFAQFLSVMERPLGERVIPLFSKEIASEDDPFADHCEIQLTDNIRFVGTVNIDETTHFFSPKVLDRSQILSFRTKEMPVVRSNEIEDKMMHCIPAVSHENFSKWIHKYESMDEVEEMLRKIHGILTNSNLDLMHRPLKKIREYVASAKGLLSVDQALDFQFMQVVFPKLRRTSPKFDITVEELKKVITGERFPRSAQILSRISEAKYEFEYFQLM